MSKGRLLFFVALFLVLSILIFKFTPKAYKNPICQNCNVILIAVDTLRADHLGLYGYSKNTSPNLDQFSKEAVVYKNFFSDAPWTIPSFATLFTSNFPQYTKMQLPTDILDSKFTTLASVFKKNGYNTFGINSLSFVSRSRNYSLGFDSFKSLRAQNNGHDINLVIPETIKTLESVKNQKFFMFVHTMEVHNPHCPPKEFDQFKGDYQGNLDCLDIITIKNNNDGSTPLSPADKERTKSLYDGEILYTDRFLGKLFDTVKTLGLDKNTIIIFTADHGQEFGERQYWAIHSYSVYNELLHVPFIIKAPGILKSGVEEKYAATINIAPTILDLVGLQAPADFKGKTIRDIGNDTAIYSETTAKWNNPKRPLVITPAKLKIRTKPAPITRESVIQNGWKLIVDDERKLTELYNLKEDPGEKNNLASKDLKQEKYLSDLMVQFKKENMVKKTSLWETLKNIIQGK